MKILVLGAGFGGLELAATLSEQLGSDVEVTLVDQSEGFIFGFSKLDVMFGRASCRRGRSIRTATSRSRVSASSRATIRAIDPGSKRVETDAGDLRGRRPRGRPRRRSRPLGHPGLARGGTRVLYARGRVRAARHPRLVRRRPGNSRGHVDTVQVPAGSERDGATHARLPHPARNPVELADLARDATPRAHPPFSGGLRGTPRRLRGARDRVAPGPARRETRRRPQGRHVRRRRRDAVRPLPRGAAPPGARSWSRHRE